MMTRQELVRRIQSLTEAERRRVAWDYPSEVWAATGVEWAHCVELRDPHGVLRRYYATAKAAECCARTAALCGYPQHSRYTINTITGEARD